MNETYTLTDSIVIIVDKWFYIFALVYMVLSIIIKVVKLFTKEK